MIHKVGQKLVYPKEYAVVQQASSAAAWWSGAYAAYDFTAATYAAAKLDLTGNGRHCADGAAFPTHMPGVGCDFNGTTQYLITPIIPVVDQTWSALIKFSAESASGGRCLFGEFKSINSRFAIFSGFTDNARYYQNGSFATGLISVPGRALSGTLGFAGRKCYLDGVPDGATMIPAGGGGVSLAIYIGAINNDGMGATQYSAAVISSFIVFPDTRSDAQMLATSAAMP